MLKNRFLSRDVSALGKNYVHYELASSQVKKQIGAIEDIFLILLSVTGTTRTKHSLVILFFLSFATCLTGIVFIKN